MAAVAPIRPLAWEPPCARGVALKSKKKKKKKKKKKILVLVLVQKGLWYLTRHKSTFRGPETQTKLDNTKPTHLGH